MYASSVHCSYYAVFQLGMFGYRKYYKNMSEALYDSSYSAENSKRQMSNQKPIGSHDFLINSIESDLRRIDKKKLQQYHDLINSLKETREHADYKEQIIDYELAIKSKDDALLLITILKQLYSV